MRSSSPCDSLLGIANHAAFCAAKRNVDHRALPGHPAGQRANFIQRHVRRKSNAALARSANDGMMHAVTDEHFEVAGIENHRNVNGDFLVRIFQEAVQTLFEPQFSRGRFKARIGGFVNIEFVVDSKRGHKNTPHQPGGSHSQPAGQPPRIDAGPSSKNIWDSGPVVASIRTKPRTAQGKESKHVSDDRSVQRAGGRRSTNSSIRSCERRAALCRTTPCSSSKLSSKQRTPRRCRSWISTRTGSAPRLL